MNGIYLYFVNKPFLVGRYWDFKVEIGDFHLGVYYRYIHVFKEIVKQVRNGIKPTFRPTLEEFDCPCDELAGVIRKCWADDPMERPDFAALKSIIRKLNK